MENSSRVSGKLVISFGKTSGNSFTTGIFAKLGACSFLWRIIGYVFEFP